MKCQYTSQKKQSSPCVKQDEGYYNKEDSPASNQTSPFKDYADSYLQENKSMNTKIRSLDFTDEVEPIHNKENRDDLSISRFGDGGGCGSDFTLSSSPQEDSGYLSFCSGQCCSSFEHVQLDSGIAADCSNPKVTVFHTPGRVRPIREPQNASPTDLKLLPALQFENAVCSALINCHKKTQKFDWTLIDKIAGDFSLQNIIGRKMGLEQVDILQELLQRDMKHLIAKLLHCLGDIDLINFARVSKTWQRIICEDKLATQMHTEAKARLMASSAKRREEVTTRHNAVSRVVLSCIQGLASTPIQTPLGGTMQKKMNQSNRSPPSRHTEFQKAANKLKHQESLKKCGHCGSPAKFYPHLQRATCIRASCGSDFCTECHCDYHGLSNCVTGKIETYSKKSGPLPGSGKSKRNLKRL